MNEALLAGCNLYECTEIHDARNFSVIERAGLRIVDNCVDNRQCTLAVILIQAGNKDMTVLFHIHLDIALCADLLNNFAARADHLTDLVHRDYGAHHLRSILGELLARLRNALEDDLVNDIVARLVGFFQCFLHHLGG